MARALKAPVAKDGENASVFVKWQTLAKELDEAEAVEATARKQMMKARRTTTRLRAAVSAAKRAKQHRQRKRR